MLPPIDIAYINLEIRSLCDDLAQRYADAGSDADPTLAPDPAELCDGLQRVLVALADLGARLPLHPPSLEGRPEGTVAARADATGAPGIDTLCNHGIDLLARLSGLAGRLGLPQHAHRIEALTLPLACWGARRGGELSQPAPVVNAAGALANRLKAPDALAELHGLMSEVVDALNPQVTQDSDETDATRPWRVLLLNRAIVATRSHRPDLMETAFSAVVEALPRDAPEFFLEALGQMEALNYPPQVREVVQRYADTWCTRRILH